jgi:hypothetical protein
MDGIAAERVALQLTAGAVTFLAEPGTRHHRPQLKHDTLARSRAGARFLPPLPQVPLGPRIEGTRSPSEDAA